MEIKKVAALGIGMIAAGIGLTLIPFLLPLSWRSVQLFLDWPILLIDRPHTSWLPLNARKHLTTLLLINIGGWALLLIVLWSVAKKVTRSRTFL
jgi:hypothetical protein